MNIQGNCAPDIPGKGHGIGVVIDGIDNSEISMPNICEISDIG